ncbi:type II secretion system protein [Paenibacillus sp. FSL K6-3166]|uniref:type IV pilus modification PilV family protein n=1 Tax=unclassified Paenibacillus TaxID=185978 RepID=UPI0015C6436E|nr:type II secretion system protein [Paenibacillus sp. VTT E-133291]
MKSGLKQEKGFTLIEVLAAIVILSIVSLVLTSYFTNAMSYSKSNQNKTIMVNLARNALFYVEKQDFDQMKKYLIKYNSIEALSKCKQDTAESPKCDDYIVLVQDTETLSQVLNPAINGVNYQIKIEYQRDLHNQSLNSSDPEKQKMAEYLLPVLVKVSRADSSGGPQSESVLEGYITDEKIR